MCRCDRYWFKGMLAVLALYPAIAGADLTVIYDSGDTQPSPSLPSLKPSKQAMSFRSTVQWSNARNWVRPIPNPYCLFNHPA